MKRTKGIEGTTIQNKMGCSTSVDKESSSKEKNSMALRSHPQGGSDQRAQQPHPCGMSMFIMIRPQAKLRVYGLIVSIVEGFTSLLGELALRKAKDNKRQDLRTK
ncbi:hypothetical protein HAX54_050942 [Datura stramonium]|uniref:Uncharacterized protein n=1 Tax=Datura stramonium TaxID=4076 RepID=A0ABS8SXZ8_DATST|nr:hypothetical protein [Datura stramonium]